MDDGDFDLASLVQYIGADIPLMAFERRVDYRSAEAKIADLHARQVFGNWGWSECGCRWLASGTRSRDNIGNNYTSLFPGCARAFFIDSHGQ
jgi:hypothetical protein